MAIWEGSLADIDPLSLNAIVQLQLEDSQALAGFAKGKQREGVLTDAQLALEMYAMDLNACRDTLADRKMAQSIAIAAIRDGPIIQEVYEQEDQLARAQLSMNSSGKDHGSVMTKTAHGDHAEAENPWAEEEMLAKASAIYNEPLDVFDVSHLTLYDSTATLDNEPEAESSAQGASRKPKTKPNLANCVGCGDKKHFFDVARVPCNHEYCRECLASLFRASMTDETLFPPRCDGKEIPLKWVRFFLPADVANEFEAKSVELSTKNRVYCHDPHCSTFIPPSDTDTGPDWVTCPHCSKSTCTICRSVAHTGDCPEDADLQLLVETAEAEQWQRCHNCSRFVELDTGCNHITCPCGAQFCYICGVKWKQCDCNAWHEQNLLARATAIADRPHDPRRQLFRPEQAARPQPLDDIPPETQRATAEATEQRNRRIGALLEDLRVNHICAHEKWRWVGGPHECEECHHDLPSYIFQCKQCHLQACNRCRRNRLA